MITNDANAGALPHNQYEGHRGAPNNLMAIYRMKGIYDDYET